MKDIKKSQQVQNKREKEKQIVDLMIHLYCRKKHKTVEKHHGLCEECEKLRNYAATVSYTHLTLPTNSRV